jgi:hypothetical protein
MISMLLPIASGILLALGQFFMKRVAVSLPGTAAIGPLFLALVRSPDLYVFVFFNICATVSYIASLRFMTMTNTFAVVFVTMGATVLCLDLVVNRVTLSALNLAGFILGTVAVLLIASR